MHKHAQEQVQTSQQAGTDEETTDKLLQQAGTDEEVKTSADLRVGPKKKTRRMAELQANAIANTLLRPVVAANSAP